MTERDVDIPVTRKTRTLLKKMKGGLTYDEFLNKHLKGECCNV